MELTVECLLNVGVAIFRLWPFLGSRTRAHLPANGMARPVIRFSSLLFAFISCCLYFGGRVHAVNDTWDGTTKAPRVYWISTFLDLRQVGD